MSAEKTSWIWCIPKLLIVNVKNEKQPSSWKTTRLLPFNAAKLKHLTALVHDLVSFFSW